MKQTGTILTLALLMSFATAFASTPPATGAPLAGTDLRIFKDRYRIDETHSAPEMRKALFSRCLKYARLDSNQRPWD
jgi:hypothetical protein